MKIVFAALVSFFLSIIGGCVITTNLNLSHRPWTVSVYYWFQSVTTIGYGDISYKRGSYEGWKVLILLPYILFLILGLALMSAMLNLVSTIVITGEWKRLCCGCHGDRSKCDPVTIKGKGRRDKELDLKLSTETII